MPDLATHLATACVIGVPLLRRPQTRTLFYLGHMLPDLVTRGIYVPLEAVGVEAGPWLMPLHTPLSYVLLCVLLAQVFPERRRSRLAFYCLLGGGLCHMALDALQKHVGGSYYWAFPVSWWQTSWGLFWPETSVAWLPASTVLIVILEGWALWRDRRTQEGLEVLGDSGDSPL